MSHRRDPYDFARQTLVVVRDYRQIVKKGGDGQGEELALASAATRPPPGGGPLLSDRVGHFVGIRTGLGEFACTGAG
jgi:hypothetical protein